MSRVEVIPETGLAEPLILLEEFLRDGEPVSGAFVEQLRKSVETGDVEILAVRNKDQTLGVIVLAYRLNISAGSLFASIEELYVRPQARRQGIASALLEAAGKRCTERNISYVEVQVDDDQAELFYAALGFEPEKGNRILSRSLALPET